MSDQSTRFPGISVIAKAALDTPEPPADDEAAAERIRGCVGGARHACAGCGYTDARTSDRVLGMMTGHPVDGDHARIKVKQNLVAVCPICHDIAHIGYAPTHGRGEVLLGGFIPQQEITAMARLCMVAKHNDGQFQTTAESYYKRLREALWGSTRKLLGDQYDGRPETFGKLLQSDAFAQRVTEPDKALLDVRYLPALDGYATATAYWARTQFGTWPESEWLNYAV
jgi:hypothetical protein